MNQATIGFVGQSPDSFSNPSYEKEPSHYTTPYDPPDRCPTIPGGCPNGLVGVSTPGVYCGPQNLVEHTYTTPVDGVMVRLPSDHVTGRYDLGDHQLTITADKINDESPEQSEQGLALSASTPSPSLSTATAPTSSMLTPEDLSVATNNDKPISITLHAKVSDANANLSRTIVTNPLHGTLSNINQTTDVLTYTPQSDYAGNDSFTFKVNDGK